METKNAVITGTFLGLEDHGFLSAFVYLDYGGSRQGFGGYALGTPASGKLNINCGLFLSRVLEVVGVEKWEQLPGRSVRVQADHCKVRAIGHFIRDQWFIPEREFVNDDAWLNRPAKRTKEQDA